MRWLKISKFFGKYHLLMFELMYSHRPLVNIHQFSCLKKIDVFLKIHFINSFIEFINSDDCIRKIKSKSIRIHPDHKLMSSQPHKAFR